MLKTKLTQKPPISVTRFAGQQSELISATSFRGPFIFPSAGAIVRHGPIFVLRPGRKAHPGNSIQPGSPLFACAERTHRLGVCIDPAVALLRCLLTWAFP